MLLQREWKGKREGWKRGRMEGWKRGWREEGWGKRLTGQSDGNQEVLKDGGKGGRMEEGMEGGKSGVGGLYLSIFPAGSSHHFHPCGYLFHTSSYSISLHSSTLSFFHPSCLPSFHSFILHLDLVDR